MSRGVRLVLCIALWASAAVAQGQTPTEALAAPASRGDAAAVNEIERRALGGDPTAQHLMGMVYITGKGRPQNDEQALRWFREGADKGHVPSAHNLAVILERSPGALRDPASAQRWYRYAAERGFARSQANLGRWLVRSHETLDEGRAWLEKAEAQGEPLAKLELGLLMLNGKGVPRDDAKAAALIRQAAEGGERDAQYHLGVLYGAGRGFAKDDQEGHRWIRKAADAGSADAQYFLASVHAQGLFGERRDAAKAADLLRRAARQGHANAQHALGLAYMDGLGVPQDRSQALGWFIEAARNGHPEASATVERVKAATQERGAARNPAAPVPAR